MMVRILFVRQGLEGVNGRKTMCDTREGAEAPSFFIVSERPPIGQWAEYDAVVVEAIDLLSSPPGPSPALLIASGPASLAGACFDAGCADFIREPWTMAELEARVRARTRPRLLFEGGRLLAEPGRVTLDGTSAPLSAPSFRLLDLLDANYPRAVPREAIAALFEIDPAAGRSVDMRIARLRKSLRQVGAARLAASIRCERGAYSMGR